MVARAIGRRTLLGGGSALAGLAWTGCARDLRPGPLPLAPIRVSLDAPLGAFDRLSGVQGSPYPEVDDDVEHVAAYRAHHVERARFPQDCPANALTLAGIFPDETADPDDPASYRFEAIDRHVRAARDAGVRILWQSSYDLGLSDRWVGLNLGGRPIRDLALWSRVLSRCLAHFTAGWAGGFERAVQDVEFLNEPDGLGGYREQPEALATAFLRFLELLEAHGRDHPGAPVRAVGPGIPLSIAEWPDYRPGFERLLDAIARAGRSLPVFSFHTYGTDTSPAGNERLARELRAMLDARGMEGTELWNTEWQASDFARALLGVDPSRAAAATPEERRLYAQASASYALSCKARWQGVVTGSYYYRAGRRAWPPGQSAPFGTNGDGSAGFFSPEGRVGALALAELLTHRIALRTPERCAVEVAADPLLAVTGLRGPAAGGVLVASLATAPRPVRMTFAGSLAPTVARAVRIDTDAQALVEEPLAITAAAGGGVEVEVELGAAEAVVVEVDA